MAMILIMGLGGYMQVTKSPESPPAHQSEDGGFSV